MSQTLRAALEVYVSPPKSQTIDAAITGATLDTFNATTAGSNVGTYFSVVTGVTYTATGTARFLANDQYGGYQLGNYMGVSANSSVTITMATPKQFMGFYYTAADANNSVKIYSGSTLLLTLSTSTLLASLPNNNTSTIVAGNGTTYQTKDYYGQPTSGLNAGEPYVYLSFLGTAGTSFDRVVITQGTTAIFESDNYAYRDAAPTLPQGYAVLPEPSTYALVGIAGVVGMFILRKKRTSPPRLQSVSEEN